MAKTSKSVSEAQEKFAQAREVEKALSKEPVDNFFEPAPKRERPEGLEVVSSGASYWEFSDKQGNPKNTVFEGMYVADFLAPKDIDQGGGKITPAGSVIGYTCVDLNMGEMTILSNSYSITKAFTDDGFSKDTIWWIEFIERTVVKGRPFNRFYIAKCKK